MNPKVGLAIAVSNLSKMYRIYSKPADMLWEILARKPRFREFWALWNLSFELRRGEMIGIMGRNGAGKSTLLRILTGTLDRTSGEIQIDGVVSSILELGTGFNPEYTGRENVYMGGLCLGMTKEMMDKKLDWVIDFSELRDVIDQPFKTYSTGMQARLTFSTAACIDPDILIIDEALAVGDAKFQVKCFDKLRRFREDGGTILLVSHDVNTINSFCDRAFLLEKGQVIEEGNPKSVSQCYYRLLFGDETSDDISDPDLGQIKHAFRGEACDLPGQKDAGSAGSVEDDSLPSNCSVGSTSQDGTGIRYGNKKATIVDYGILDMNGRRVKMLASRRSYAFFLRVVFHSDMERYSMGFHIRDSKGRDIFGITTESMKVHVPPRRNGDMVECVFRFTMWLTNGTFFLTAGIAEWDGTQCDSQLDGLLFEVMPREGIFPCSVVDLNGVLVVNETKGEQAISPGRSV